MTPSEIRTAAEHIAMRWATVGDYVFVPPVGQVTVHAQGLRLLLLLLVGTALVRLMLGSAKRPKS